MAEPTRDQADMIAAQGFLVSMSTEISSIRGPSDWVTKD